LRLTCRELYQKTTYDAAIRYGLQLEELDIFLDYKQLCWLLHLTKTPTLRDNIGTLYLYATDPRKDPEADPYAMEVGRVQLYFNSSDCVHMLAECFQNLRHGKRLTQIEAAGRETHHIIFSALRMAQFPRRILAVTLNPQYILDARYKDLGEQLSNYASYVKNVQIVPPKTYFLNNKLLRLENDEGQERGHHTQDHRVVRLEALWFLKQLDAIETLVLDGCSDWPHLRICNGCNDVFAKNIATIKYTNLTKLRFLHVFISGGRLRRFIKEHASTLTSISFSSVTLTDGSWRSIAQGLLKVSGLIKFSFWEYLYQKTPMTSTEQLPPECLLYDDKMTLYYSGKDTIRTFLQYFIRYFATIPYVPQEPEFWEPQYYIVSLFEVSSLEEDTHETEAWSKVERYAKELFIE
jgi:hypothetical protein